METICEACGYQRKPSDQAPDWQCPACGKAYAKTMHDSHGAASGSAPSFPAESPDPANEGFAYQPVSGYVAFGEPGKTRSNSRWILGVVIGISFVWGIPILSNPSSASAVLLHGVFGQVCIAMLAIWGMVVLARRWSANIDTNNPMSRFAFFVKFLALFCGGFFFLSVVWLRSQEHAQIAIQRNGERAMADIVRIYTGACGKRSCSINVEYAFTPTSETDEASQPIHGYAQLGTDDRSNDPDIVYARTNHRVPIAYEVGHPQLSVLNFNDDVFRLDHSQAYLRTVGLLGKIFLGIFLGGLALAGLSIRLNSSNQVNPG